MITLLSSHQDWFASEIVFKALTRSFSKNQVQHLRSLDVIKTPGIYVLINPKNISIKSFPPQSKIILLGKIEKPLADELHIQISEENNNFSNESIINFKPIDSFEFPIQSRPFVRYDFPNEWNNLGFGAITNDHSVWSVSQNAHSENAIAVIEENNAYITHHDFDDKSCVWINRAAGLVDCVNWHFIEYFISAYRFQDLISLAYLLDIPANTESAVTMRLDCDEDILSAQPLFEAYCEKKIPFSLAVKTSLPITQLDIEFLKKIKNKGGAILSHSVNHKVSWGVDYYDAFEEALFSKITLETEINTAVNFAVSPFHSNTVYSVKALEDAGFTGFIGGIIANDPEYLISRGGLVPFADKIISHSQQCMMHGDCLLKEPDPLRIYKKAFDIAKNSKTFFGFLDHPFSPRYQYGWETEALRIKSHVDLIDYMRKESHVLFMNENQCLQFMIDKSNAEIHCDKNKNPLVRLTKEKQSEFSVAASLNQKVF
ncbi:MAG: hypothetical protein NTU49_03415 [Gammaproteobacteria bacterium]|nr:hypothetical protein [Gammaproteobacteria bacterium]